MLWSLAAVECQNRELTSALIVRANVETGSLAPLEIAMVSQALADLGACLEDHVNVDTLLQRAASIARDFTPRHAKQTLRALRTCGLRNEHSASVRRLFAALKQRLCTKTQRTTEKMADREGDGC
jgi:hypothetical protein